MTPDVYVQFYVLVVYMITLTTALSVRNPAATSQNTSTPQSWNVVKNGRYNILGCSDDDTRSLQQLLGSLRAYIQPAIDDADQAVVRPSPAFTTFFHSALIAADRVSKILNDISTGRSVYPPTPEKEERFHTTNVLVHGHPTLVCITEPGWRFGRDGDDPDLDGYDLCRDNPALVMDHFRGTQYINVCPQFFTIGLPPVPPKRQCLRVNKILNRFQGSGASMTHFQVWVLLQEIAGYYMGGIHGAGVKDFGYYLGRGEGVSHVNDCVKLGAARALRNEMSFVYYVASIYGQCTAFPDLSELR